MSRRLSLHHLSILDADPFELANAARAGGFDSCGVRIVAPDPTAPRSALVDDAPTRRRFRQHLGAVGVTLLDVEAVWLREATDVDALGPALATAAYLGAGHVLTAGQDPHRPRLLDTLGRFASLAVSHGLRLSLEPITYTAVPDLAAAWGLAVDTGSDHVKVLVDSLQFFRGGADFGLLERLPAAALPYAQISDAPLAAPGTTEGLRREARTARLVPGEGELDLPRLLRTLPPGIPLAVEAPTLELAERPPAATASRLGTATRLLLQAADTNEVPA